jgi:hypothetical protein
MKKYLTAGFASLAFALSACTTTSAPTLTPLELQSLQSRTYEAGKDIVFPSVVSVFQDLGYTITQGDIETGLITAESATENSAGMVMLFGVSSMKQTGATAFVEELGGETRVRLNFVEKQETSSAYGRQDRKDTPILNADIYQAAFERVENAVFVRQG